jgi:hypothetical protein
MRRERALAALGALRRRREARAEEALAVSAAALDAAAAARRAAAEAVDAHAAATLARERAMLDEIAGRAVAPAAFGRVQGFLEAAVEREISLARRAAAAASAQEERRAELETACRALAAARRASLKLEIFLGRAARRRAAAAEIAAEEGEPGAAPPAPDRPA